MSTAASSEQAWLSLNIIFQCYKHSSSETMDQSFLNWVKLFGGRYIPGL